MTKLTELAILSRAKGNRTMATADLKSIRRLNLWGLDLDDVSVLTAVPQIEILSLSVK